MRSRRGETREGSESQKMQDLGKSYWKGILSSHNLSTLSCDPARSSLPYGQGGGTLRAFRHPNIGCLEDWVVGFVGGKFN